MEVKDEAIRRKFIIDEEIDLFEKQADDDVQKKDLLNTVTYVNTLTNCVMNAPEDRSFTIGLFGEWGSGKSSIIRTFSKDIVSKYEEKKQKVKVITYDAWKYANDSFRRMFLLRMQEELGFEGKDLFNSFYLNSSEDAHIDTKINWREITIGVLMVSALVFAICRWATSSDFKIAANALVALASLVYAVVRGAFKEVKVNIQRPHLFAPEQFEACFNEMCDKALSEKGVVNSYLKYIKGETGEDGISRLIIVIDNVDRCTPELAYELLTNIKNFLGQKYNTIFVIPVDEEALKKHIVRNNPLAKHESDEFLRKFFNICIRIKPFHREEMFDFADQMNTKYGLDLNSNTIGLISQEFASNPRRIIQMMNNLIAEFQNIPSQFVEKDESLICKLLIIREEYPAFYKALVNDATLLFNTEKQKPFTEKDQGGDESLKRFLYRTNAISQTYKDQVETVESILSNSVVFDKIPQNVIDEISSDDIKETKAYISNAYNKSKLLNYILQKIQVYISRDAYKAGVSLYMNYLIRISGECELTRADYARIADIVRDLSISKFLEGESSMQPIEIFAQKMADEKQNVLNGLINYMLRDEQNFQKLPNEMVRDGVFFGYTIWGGNMLTDLKARLQKCYDEKPKALFEYDYGKNKNTVFGDEIIGKIIEAQFKDNELVEKNENLLIKLTKTIVIDEKHLATAIEKIAEKIDNYKNNNESKQRIEQLSNYMSLILSSLPKEYVLHNTTPLESFVGKICHTYSENLNGRSYNRSFYADVQDLEKRKQFVDFFFQASRLSQKVIIPETYLKTMLSVPETKDYLLGKLNELLNNKYPMSNYANAIFAISVLSSDLLKLYKFLFVVTTTSNNAYIIADDVVAQKLKPVLGQLFDDNSELKSEAEEFVLNMFANERCSKILMDIISAETTENIQKLPQPIHKKIIPIFNDHFEDYSDKMPIMLVMAEASNATVQAKVVTKIVNMLTTPGKEKDAFSLIKVLKTRDKRHVVMLVSTLEGMNISDSLKPERDECLEILNK
jgi:hypothetical protein